MSKTARITGITSQDPHDRNVRLKLHFGDLTDSTNLIRIIQEAQPDEIYNLAAQSHVADSFESPGYTANSDTFSGRTVVRVDPRCLRFTEVGTALGDSSKARQKQGYKVFNHHE